MSDFETQLYDPDATQAYGQFSSPFSTADTQAYGAWTWMERGAVGGAGADGGGGSQCSGDLSTLPAAQPLDTLEGCAQDFAGAPSLRGQSAAHFDAEGLRRAGGAGEDDDGSGAIDLTADSGDEAGGLPHNSTQAALQHVAVAQLQERARSQGESCQQGEAAGLRTAHASTPSCRRRPSTAVRKKPACAEARGRDLVRREAVQGLDDPFEAAS